MNITEKLTLLSLDCKLAFLDGVLALTEWAEPKIQRAEDRYLGASSKLYGNAIFQNLMVVIMFVPVFAMMMFKVLRSPNPSCRHPDHQGCSQCRLYL